MFSQWAHIGWGWPGVQLTLLGHNITWNVIGYGADEGGLAYLFAFLIATFTAQCINFPLQVILGGRACGTLWHGS